MHTPAVYKNNIADYKNMACEEKSLIERFCPSLDYKMYSQNRKTLLLQLEMGKQQVLHSCPVSCALILSVCVCE
jgi:hypothetical protein